MELHIKDRIYIPQLLPQQNNFMGFNTKREILNKVMLTKEDQEKYHIEQDEKAGRITWDIEKDMAEPLVVDFTPQELSYLKQSCEALVETAYPDDFWAVVQKIYDSAN